VQKRSGNPGGNRNWPTPADSGHGPLLPALGHRCHAVHLGEDSLDTASATGTFHLSLCQARSQQLLERQDPVTAPTLTSKISSDVHASQRLRKRAGTL
jgi:hypothetical protein